MGCTDSKEIQYGGACYKPATGFVKALPASDHPILSGIDALDWEFLTESGFNESEYGKLCVRKITIEGTEA